jgi:GTPase Era involved in 16S rRNA processing
MFVEGTIKMESVDISTLHVKKQHKFDCHNTFIIQLFEKLSTDQTVVVQKLNEMEQKVGRNDKKPMYMQKMHDLSNKCSH